MDEIAFREKMKQDGYGEVFLREFDPDYAEDTHTHEFGASVLVLDGEISLTLADRVVTCKAGDIFALDANIPHAEQVGGAGVRFLAARK